MVKLFSREESIAVIVIFSIIFLISFFNFRTALRRGRDNERENDLGDLAKTLDQYRSKFSTYPGSLDQLKAISSNVPKDPGTPYGYSYLYLTDGRFFQIYASLEGKTNESAYNPQIAALGLKCGNYICNYGKASGNVPLDKSIEVYERSLVPLH